MPVYVWPGRRYVFVVSGIHGDETSGPRALNIWRRHVKPGQGIGVVVVPSVMPADGSRLKSGRDPNRDFSRRRLPVISEIRDLVTQFEPNFFIDVHEDEESDEAYVFARRSLAGNKARLLARAMSVKARPWSVGDSGSSENVFTDMGIPSATVEVPPTWPMAKRVAFLIRTLNEAMNIV
jgi:predicted deacylase